MARPKKADLKNSTAIPDGAAAAPAASAVDTTLADNAIESAKGRFTQAVVLGLLPDGNIDIATSNPNYAVLQWLLARAQFELLTHERASYQNKKAA
jgi:hypothetical protein